MEFPYTPESERQKRAAEISANLKHIHDTQTAYCQACYMELSECPGHEGNLPREHGTFYMQLLKERTLLREEVDAGHLERVVALETLEGVFDSYHDRMVDGEMGGIIQDFDEALAEGFAIPLQLGDPARKQGYVCTQVVDDRTVDLKPGQMHNVPDQVKQWAEVTMEEGYFDVADKPVDEGIKHDEGKERWDLLPPSIEHVVDVYTIGAAKYDDDNWAKGMGYRRIFGAMMRHAWKWFWGESYDQQDGQHHLASVAWACLTLMHYEDEGVGTDDRAFMPLDSPMSPPQALGVDGFEDRKPVVPPECEPEELAVESDCTFREYAGYVGINVCPVHGWH